MTLTRPAAVKSGDIMERALVEVDDPERLDRDRVLAVLRREQFVCIRGICDPRAVRSGVARLRDSFDPAEDHAGYGEQPAEIMSYYQKLVVSGEPPAQGHHEGRAVPGDHYVPRLARIIYTPLWTNDRFQLHDTFRRAAIARNILHGLRADFSIDRVENGLWTAARIQHYPAGGGFLCAHKDKTLARVLKEDGLPDFHQLAIVFTRKGEDFERGGAFLDLPGGRFFYEETCELGDVVLFDGANTVHGIEDIDGHRKLDLTTLAGRLVGFVTLYRDMRPAARA